ncbi:disulfide bond formation protein B [Sphingobium sp. H39-3-25]|uniref:disulfide bond formation protein B n=1 Tax=Sphingobium arseniciresistens TaxID=3030834 RepID=UPI0023B956E4|nr:disulfide bond formation protein B [Sphingobium arseniciresistens]
MTAAKALSNARLVAIMAPVLLLGGALVSQYVFGLHPCEMCMWQRWPHLAGIILALDAIVHRRRERVSAVIVVLAALAIGTSGAIGAFHAGVEYGWWEGLTTCSTSPSGGSAQDVLNNILAAPLTRCDVAPWSLFGISLAGYNAIFSLGATLLCFVFLARWRKAA